MQEEVENPGGGRRRVPRRTFESPIGALVAGVYALERSYQVSEGGMMLSSARELKRGDLLVVSFFIAAKMPIMVRAIVRSVVTEGDLRYGVEFVGLDFHSKREIRNFVASATRQETVGRS